MMYNNHTYRTSETYIYSNLSVLPTNGIGISELVAHHLGCHIIPISVTDSPPSPVDAKLHPPLVGIGASPQTHVTIIAAITWVWGREEIKTFEQLHP